MKHLDLFSGIGGFALAARWAGWRTIGFCEIDSYCQKVLKKNFPDVPIVSDIHDVTAESFSERPGIVTGGFPCQPFSIAGKQKGAADDRYLWPQMLRVIKEYKPTWVIAENVAHIVKMELDNVLSDLEAADYSTWPVKIPACGIGAPHRRMRVWIVAYANSQRQSQSERCICEQRQRVKHSSQVMADSEGNLPSESRFAWERRSRFNDNCISNGNGYGANHWESEPAVGRVANGIPQRVDRLRGLGNAIVPQVAYEIFRAINTVA